MLNYHMGVLEDNTETKELLDKAIKEMKEDGTDEKIALGMMIIKRKAKELSYEYENGVNKIKLTM